MAVATTPAQLLRIADLPAGRLAALLDLAAEMRVDPHGFRGPLAGEAVAALLDGPSTRTRVSVEVAAHRLGMLPVVLRPGDLGLAEGEPVTDTARVLSAYVAAIVVATTSHFRAAEIAAAAAVPVLNGVTSAHHPCQTLADLLTLRDRFGALAGLRVTWVGAATNVLHSLLDAAGPTGLSVAAACPPDAPPDPGVLAGARASGADVELAGDPRAAVAGAQVVMTDAWPEAPDGTLLHRAEELEAFHVDAALLAAAGPGAVVMHPLPAHRGREIAADVLDGPACLAWAQAANRLPVEQAVLYTLITRRW